MAIPSFAAVFSSLAVILLAGISNARDLRPSEHGLEYQNPGAMENSSPQMQSFFKGNSWSSSDVALPKAMNTSLPPQWWTRSHRNRSGAAADGGGGDHIRGALLVASLVCGIIGVSLLIASAFIYFFKFRKQSKSRSLSSLSVSETTNIIPNKWFWREICMYIDSEIWSLADLIFLLLRLIFPFEICCVSVNFGY